MDIIQWYRVIARDSWYKRLFIWVQIRCHIASLTSMRYKPFGGCSVPVHSSPDHFMRHFSKSPIVFAQIFSVGFEDCILCFSCCRNESSWTGGKFTAPVPNSTPLAFSFNFAILPSHILLLFSNNGTVLLKGQHCNHILLAKVTM